MEGVVREAGGNGRFQTTPQLTLDGERFHCVWFSIIVIILDE